MKNKILIISIILVIGVIFRIVIYKKTYTLERRRVVSIKNDTYLFNMVNFLYDDGKEYLYFKAGNGNKTELNIINTSNNNSISHVSFDNLRDKTEPIHFVLKSKDKILIDNHSQNCFSGQKYFSDLVLMNGKGEVLYKRDIEPLYKNLSEKQNLLISPNINNRAITEKGNLISLLNFIAGYLYKGDSIYSTKGNEFEYKIEMLDLPVISKIENPFDENNKDLKITNGLDGFYKKFVNPSNYEEFLFKVIFGKLSLTTDENENIYLIHSNHDSIYKVNPNNFQIEKVYPFYSRHFKNEKFDNEDLNSIIYAKIDRVEAKIWHIQDIRSFIQDIVYDKYRKLFYVIVLKGTHDIMDRYKVGNYRDFALVVMDKNMKYLTEFDFLNRDYYPRISISKEGIVLIPNHNTDNINTGDIRYDIYSFK